MSTAGTAVEDDDEAAAAADEADPHLGSSCAAVAAASTVPLLTGLPWLSCGVEEATGDGGMRRVRCTPRVSRLRFILRTAAREKG